MGTHAPLSDMSEDKIAEFETAVMPIPQFDPENPQMISQGPSVCIFNKSDPQEVLASWLFVQYLLSNDVQIAYSETEGYVPVTSKAQGSEAYQDYLSRCGEDNSTYYDVKIQAAKLLLENTGHTFVTPVFNGSTSLRNASGQLVENTVKSVRRGETVDEAYMEELFEDITSLYRLDQPGASGVLEGSAKEDLGELPRTAVILLASLAGVWALMLVYFLITAGRKRRNSQ